MTTSSLSEQNARLSEENETLRGRVSYFEVLQLLT